MAEVEEVVAAQKVKVDAVVAAPDAGVAAGVAAAAMTLNKR